MDTLKTAVVVILLLAVLYGVYVVLSKPDAPLSQEIAWHEEKAAEPLQIDMGGSTSATETPTKPAIRAELTAPGTPDSNSPASGNAAPGSAPSFSDTPTSASAFPELPSTNVPYSPSSNAFSSDKNFTDTSAPGIPSPGSTSPSVAAPTLLPPGAPEKPSAEAGNFPSSSTRDTPSLPPLRDVPKPNDNFSNTNSGGFSSSPALEKAANALDSGPAKPFPQDGAPLTEPSDNRFIPGNADIPARPSSFAGAAETKSDAASATSAPLLQASSDTANPDLGGDAARVSTKNIYAAAWSEAHTLIEKGDWYQALIVLSKFYNSPALTADQHKELLDLLDPLAGKVVYSTEHLIETAYEVQRGETWASVAEKHQVPWELLFNINGGQSAELLVPGTKLKVLRGPFRAEVNLKSNELTLFVGQLYAGRFPISVGSDPAPRPGEYRVQEKSLGRVYYAGDGRTMAAEDPHNPFGRVWIGLGSELSIHGSPDSGSAANLGCISLSPLDAQDVYNILSQNSSVVVR